MGVGADEVHSRWTKLSSKLEARIDAVVAELRKDIAPKVTEHEDQVSQLYHSLEKDSARIAGLLHTLEGVQPKVNDSECRIWVLEQHVNDLKDCLQDITPKVKEHEKCICSLDQRCTCLNDSCLNDIAPKVIEHEAQIAESQTLRRKAWEKLENVTSELKKQEKRVCLLEERLQEEASSAARVWRRPD